MPERRCNERHPTRKKVVLSGLLNPDANLCFIEFKLHVQYHLSKELNIDTKRVYVAGYSSGGMMSHRLACELSDRIAAISSVAANIPEKMAPVWAPSRPVPVLMISGTDDPYAPWDGGEQLLSVDDTVEFWATQDLCSAAPTITQLPDIKTWDGTTASKTVYSGEDGVEVVLYAVEGGGHTWPGSYSTASLGRTSMDFNASEVIWQFFKEHPIK
jgi:polyhydroxybutyrate depolymerase